MTDPIFYVSMLLGLLGIYILISAFGDDDDDNGGDGERYIYNIEFVKASNWYIKIIFEIVLIANLFFNAFYK